MAEPKFTAADADIVRHQIERVMDTASPDWHITLKACIAMLAAFAIRLDTEAKMVQGFHNSQDAAFIESYKQVCETAREQGRREVYAEIAKMPPFHEIHGMRGCVFCLAHDEWDTDTGTTFAHDADCLYVRARAAVESAQAKS